MRKIALLCVRFSLNERLLYMDGGASARLWPPGDPLSVIVQVSVNVTPAALSMAVATVAAHPILMTEYKV